MDDLQFFDSKQEFTIVSKSLPHWAQARTICFITWRTADSLPSEAVESLILERQQLLRDFGVRSDGVWKFALSKLPALERSRLQWSIYAAWDRRLDNRAGECLLARPELSRIVEDSLLHFDGDRYVLTDAIVMPNHVHLLVAFREEEMLLRQCTSWKRFTGVQIQSALRRHGEFWQVEQFDHLVRSEEQFAYFRRYIADNPKKAGLQKDSFRWYSKQL